MFGIVGNEPIDIRSVQLNQKIGIEKSLISDWMIIESGRLIGGYTIRAVRDGLPESQRPSGTDDRLIPVTTDLKMQIELGGDGRKVIVPKNWETHTTSNGRLVAAPFDWDLHEYEDKSFAMIPRFKSVETIHEIIEDENDLILVFKQPHLTTFLQKIKISNDEEVLDVALYWFLNEN